MYCIVHTYIHWRSQLSEYFFLPPVCMGGGGAGGAKGGSKRQFTDTGGKLAKSRK